MKALFLISSLTIILTSCHSVKAGRLSSAPIPMCKDSYLQWNIFNGNIGTPKYAGLHMPKKYTAFILDADAIARLFSAIKAGKVQEMTVPVYDSCITFLLQPSGTMSEALQAANSTIQSYRGLLPNDGSHYASIDYDGTLLRIRVETPTGAVIIDPFEMDNGLFYLQYHISDSSVPKVPFEKGRSR